MPTKEVRFQKGPLGLMTQGLGGMIEIVYCTEDGQAYCKGLAPGDVIVSVNGKPLVDQLRNTGDSEEFARLVTHIRNGSADRTITLGVQCNPKAVSQEVLRVNEQNVALEAGVMYKRDFQVKAGQILRLRFFTTEHDVDIGFSVEEQGHGHILLPRRGRWTCEEPFGPLCFTVMRDGKICLVWDNTHSWVRGKTLSYFCELLPPQSDAQKAKLLFEECARLKSVVQLVDRKVTNTEALLKHEKKNRKELQDRLEEVTNQLDELRMTQSGEANLLIEKARNIPTPPPSKIAAAKQNLPV